MHHLANIKSLPKLVYCPNSNRTVFNSYVKSVQSVHSFSSEMKKSICKNSHLILPQCTSLCQSARNRPSTFWSICQEWLEKSFDLRDRWWKSPSVFFVKVNRSSTFCLTNLLLIVSTVHWVVCPTNPMGLTVICHRQQPATIIP